MAWLFQNLIPSLMELLELMGLDKQRII